MFLPCMNASVFGKLELKTEIDDSVSPPSSLEALYLSSKEVFQGGGDVAKKLWMLLFSATEES